MRGKPLNLATSVNYALQIATVLEVAHQRGILHGCLRPSAIFVILHNRIKVLEFGPQTAHEPLHPWAIASNLAYSAPEHLRGEKWDYRADFFSFGAVLFEMLAGVSPFQRDSSSETARSVLQDDPRLPSELNPGIPGIPERLVKKYLAKDRANRPWSAREIVSELQS